MAKVKAVTDVECVNAAHDKLLEIGNDSAVSPAATQGEHDLNWLVGEIRKIPGVL